MKKTQGMKPFLNATLPLYYSCIYKPKLRLMFIKIKDGWSIKKFKINQKNIIESMIVNTIFTSFSRTSKMD